MLYCDMLSAAQRNIYKKRGFDIVVCFKSVKTGNIVFVPFKTDDNYIKYTRGGVQIVNISIL